MYAYGKFFNKNKTKQKKHTKNHDSQRNLFIPWKNLADKALTSATIYNNFCNKL